jgi:hypothetical protein
MAQAIVLTVFYLMAAGLSVWGIWLAIKGTWLSPELRIVNNNDGTTTDTEESFKLRRFPDLWRLWPRLPPWRRTATGAQIAIAAGVIVGALCSIGWLWWDALAAPSPQAQSPCPAAITPEPHPTPGR